MFEVEGGGGEEQKERERERERERVNTSEWSLSSLINCGLNPMR